MCLTVWVGDFLLGLVILLLCGLCLVVLFRITLLCVVYIVTCVTVGFAYGACWPTGGLWFVWVIMYSVLFVFYLGCWFVMVDWF